MNISYQYQKHIESFTEALFQHSLLCCIANTDTEDQVKLETEQRHQERLDRVEQAFRKFDLDQDGFLSWPEFKQVSYTSSLANN